MHDEHLNESLYFGLDHAREKFAVWVADYNFQRPHPSLEHLPVVAYLANLAATGDLLRDPDQLR